jgi:L-ribulokinase
MLRQTARALAILILAAGVCRAEQTAGGFTSIALKDSATVSHDLIQVGDIADVEGGIAAEVAGLNLGSSAPVIFRALVEATAFGSRKIVERFESEGVPIREIIALGGVAKKSPFVMQTLANVHNRPIKVARSEQTCALGAAMFAAVAAGEYETVEKAIEHMEAGFEREYLPDPGKAAIYDVLYDKYTRLGEFVEAETVRGKRDR